MGILLGCVGSVFWFIIVEGYGVCDVLGEYGFNGEV